MSLRVPMKRIFKSLPGPIQALGYKFAALGWLVILPLRNFIVPDDVLPQIKHLPLSVLNAVKDALKNRELNKRLKDRYFSNRLVLVAALPKSASSVIGSAIAAILGQNGREQSRGYADYMLENQTSNLRPELAKNFWEGGVLKYHTLPTGDNLAVLQLLKIRYILLFRHPADQLAAFYCDMQVSLRNLQAYYGLEESEFWFNHIFPVEKKYVYAGADGHACLDYLMKRGYLYATLRFMTDWLRFRSPKQSLVITYEEFVAEPTRLFNNIARFLLGQDLKSGDIRAKIDTIGKSYVQHRQKEFGEAYKHGYTGKVGVWQDYFSAKNREDYLKVTRSFVEHYPEASRLLAIYPDLLTLEGAPAVLREA